MPNYESEMALLPEEVSFGVSTIRFASLEDLKKWQVGYAFDAQGYSLSGDADGEWRANWIVIGQDDTCGDPIFIDAALDGFPVYTAMHGQGGWRPVRIATTMEGFRQALRALSLVALGREHPVALGNNPLTAEERADVLSHIREHNPDSRLEFWVALLDAS